MQTVAIGALVVGTILGVVDFLSHLKNLGDKASQNAVLKNVLAFLGAFGVLWIAAQTSFAGPLNLHDVFSSLPATTKLSTLSAADLAFASLLFAFPAASVATFRKALDRNQSAAQPSLTNTP